MEDQKSRVLRPRRRGPPPDHTYSNFVSSGIGYQFNSKPTYDPNTVAQDLSVLPLTSTAISLPKTTNEVKKFRDPSSAVNVRSLQSLGEVIAWLKEDSTSLNRDKVSSTLNRYEITDSVRENSAVILNVMEQPKPSSFSNSTESSQNKGLGIQSIVKLEVSQDGVSWQSDMSLRQRDCVVQKITSSLYQQQCAFTGLEPDFRAPSGTETMCLGAQQLEDNMFQSSSNQEEYYYKIAGEILQQRVQGSVSRESLIQSERKRKQGTNLLRSLLQGVPVPAFSFQSENSNSTETRADTREETISSPDPALKKRRKKRRRNEYDFGQRKKYPKQERHKVEYNKPPRSGLCLISSHKVQSRADQFTVPVTSGTILEECAEICDLRNSEGHPQESVKTDHNLVTDPSVKTPRESCPFCVKCKLESKERSLRRRTHQWKRGERYSTRLMIKHYKFPFTDLPLECKMHVFSFLDAQSKATASQVCLDWKSLLYDSDAWTKINFDFLDCNFFTPNPKRTKQRDAIAKSVYEAYQARVKQFIDFQSEHIHPRVEVLAFNFDIGNFMDNWYAHLKKFLQNADLKKLMKFECNWQVTKAKPGSLERYCCILNKTRVLFKLHHYRCQIFYKLLKQLTEESPHLTVLKMPFDWSERAVLFLCRWKEVEELRLLQYLNLRPVSQICVDVVLRSLPYLTLLQMDICIPVYSHCLLFSLSHNSLVHLDLSNCQGFFLKRLSLPRLQTIQLSCRPWQGALMDGEVRAMPCLYSLLCQGTPRLDLINRHKLHGYWQQFSYQELETVFSEVCPCSKHWVRENVLS